MTLPKRTAFLIILLSLLFLSLSGCSGVKPSLSAQPPGTVPFRPALKQEASTLNVPLEMSSEDLGRALSNVVPRQLYQGSTRTRGVSAGIKRSGAIRVSAADNYLYLTVPVALSLNFGIFDTPALPVTLKFRAAAQVSPDWRLTTELRYLGLSDLLAEQVGVGPLSIKPRSIVEGLTQPLQQVLSDLVNRNLNEGFPLRAQVARAWEAAQKPILVDQKYNAWLKLSPREVTLFPLQAKNDRVSLSVGITTFAELVVGQAPVAQPPVPLPPLKLVNSLQRGFRIALNADLFYKDIASAAAPLLLNKEFSSEGGSIVLKSFEVYGNGDKFVIKVETQGAVDGVFYLTGKPHFDPASNRFSVTEVDFDLQTRSLLLASADWLLHSTIRDRIQEKLNLDLTEKLEQSRAMAGQALAQRKLVDHVMLKGEVKSLRLGDVLLQQDRISLQVYAEGESALVFQ